MKSLLHVGSGAKGSSSLPDRYDPREWTEVRLDIDPGVAPDIVGDIRDMRDVRSGTFDALFSSHNLEHLYPHEVPLALSEFRRILKSGGHVFIVCPDIQSIAAFVAQGNLTEPIYESQAGPITPIDVLYGHGPSLARGNLYMAHRTGFTAQSLAQAMSDAGFADIRVMQRKKPPFDLWAEGFRNDAGMPVS